MTTQRVIAINNFGLQQRERTSAGGKVSSRFTVTIDAKPLEHVFDPVELGRGPSEAIAAHLRKQVMAIGENASPSTLATRANAQRAFETGSRGALKRYAGGRMGPMAPNQSSRLFNDSGRLAKGIFARYGKAGEWVINFPANRMNPSTFPDGIAALERMYMRLVALVPEFADTKALIAVPEVSAAIVQGAKDIIRRNADLRDRLSRARMNALRQAMSLFTG